LLAEARGHHVIPSVRVINDLGRRDLYRLQISELGTSLERSLEKLDKTTEPKIISYFGTSPDPAYRELARRLFDRFPCPLLEIGLR
jgi:hypothetical protein